MGGTSFDPTGTNPAGATPQQGAPATKPSLWDTWTQKAYSLRPLGSTLQQAGNNLEQRSLNMLHGDGFRTDAQAYPPPPPPQALAARPPPPPPVRGGITAGGGLVQNPVPNDQGHSQTPGQMSPYSRACVLAGLRGMVAHDEGMDLLPNGGYGSFAANGRVVANPRNLNGIAVNMKSNDARIADPASLTGHPGVAVKLNRRDGKVIPPTTAFGRYQILDVTADDPRHHFTDFSPAGQDAAMNKMLGELNMVNPAMRGDWGAVFANGRKTWASLPGDYHHQGGKDPDETKAAFDRAIQSAPECK
ncbi:hypothetical protein [Granulicella sp. S156]|uniref:hypothetical protein n=1 Tax=Granulicella sp. S156 TaxID=1747224 RepID=UPI00131D2F02|nr:hypothetical protein [Granulicella sp. S156]